MEFYFRSLDKSGRLKVGSLEAKSRTEAISRLAEQQLYLLDLRAGKKDLLTRLQEPRGAAYTVGRNDVQNFISDLGQLISSGIPIEGSLRLAAEIAERPGLRKVIETIRHDLRSGSSFAESCAKHTRIFPPHMVAAFRAAERTGRLEQALTQLAQAEAQILEFRDKLVSSLVYPSLLLGMVLLTFALVVFVVLPEFAPLFEMAGDKLPGPTKMLIFVGNMMRGGGGAAIAVLVLLGALGAFAAYQNPSTRKAIHLHVLQSKFLRDWLLPPDLIRATQTLGSSLTVGVSLDAALNLAADSATNEHVRAALNAASMSVRRGEKLSSCLQVHAFLPILLVHFVKIGEETGNLGEMCMESSKHMTRAFQKRLNYLLAILPPVVTLGLGGLVAALVGSLLYGMISLNYSVL